ncbi:MAG: hypothetical protein QXR76_03270 [Candidatus Bathyarchaeia archaeon]
MVSKTVGITAIILLLLLTNVTFSSAEISVAHQISVESYASTTIIISFAYADNVTKSDVYSANRSLWRLETTPISVTFTTDAIDVFYFTVTINYAIETNQTLLIDVYSGSQRMHDNLKLNVDAHTITLVFNVVTAEEPHFPTVEEYANIVMERFPTRQDFQDWINYQREQMNIIQQNLVTMWIVVGFNACTSIASVIIVLFRRPRHEE